MRTKPRYTPTPADRETVKSMAATGFPHEAIARCLGTKGIDDKTLRKYFRRDLDTAMTMANASIANKTFQMAMSGIPALLIFWCKTRLGWKETDRHELTGADGESLLSVEMVDRILNGK